MIHRYWTGPALPDAAVARERLVTMNPGEELRDWTDDSLPAEIVTWLDQHAKAVIPADGPRHRSNMVRLWALDTYGGWYVDHDVVMLRPFARLPYPMAASIGRRLASCVLGLPAHHPLLVAALDRVTRPAGPPRACPDVSGDRMLESIRSVHGPDVRLLPLPFDALGRWTGATAWAVHLWQTSSSRRS